MSTNSPDAQHIRLVGIARDEAGVTAPFTGEITIGSPITPTPPDPPQTGTVGLTYVRTLGLPPLYMAFAYGDMTGRIVNDQVHLLFSGDEVNIRSPIYEVRVPGEGATVCEFVREYPTPYLGADGVSKRGTWIQNSAFQATVDAQLKEWERTRDVRWYAMAKWYAEHAEKVKGKPKSGWTWVDFSSSATPILNGGHWYDPETDLLYISYACAYNVSGRPDWNFLATRLKDDGSAECFGPWRMHITDGDGVEKWGPRAGSYMRPDPRNGDILISATIGSGNIGFSWGPNIGRIPRNRWPNDTTPAGPDPNLDIVCTSRDLYYYYMGDKIDLTTGLAEGPVRSFRRRKDLYIWEPWTHENTSAGTVAPYTNPAHYNGVGSWTDMDSIGGILPLLDRLIFFSGYHGSVDQNPQSPTAAHGFYANSVNGWKCTHGFPAVPAGITGPCSSSRYPSASAYDWAVLDAVKNDETVDWEAEPMDEENLEAKFGIVTAPNDSVGNAKSNAAGFFDERTRKYYTIAQGADRGYTNWGLYSAYIHEWDVA